MKSYEPLSGSLDGFDCGLLIYESLHQGEKINFIDPPATCDLCGTPFESKRFMVDCMLHEANGPWGCICAKCFYNHGLEIGWGKGQLYTHMKNGTWILTAGIREC